MADGAKEGVTSLAAAAEEEEESATFAHECCIARSVQARGIAPKPEDSTFDQSEASISDLESSRRIRRRIKQKAYKA